LFLDLACNVESWECPRPVTAAVLCAAVTKGDDFARDPEGAARVNIVGIPQLISKLQFQGAYVVFLSSSAVFDGSCRFVHADAPLTPLTEYGRHKAVVERQVLEFGGRSAVIRLSKVLEPGFPLFQQWIESLRKGDIIHPFSDHHFAPVPVRFVAAVLERLLESRCSGVLQVSAREEITYAQAAHYIAACLGAPQDLVRPISSRENRPDLVLPGHTTLDIQRLSDELGLEPPDVWSTIEEAISGELSRSLDTHAAGSKSNRIWSSWSSRQLPGDLSGVPVADESSDRVELSPREVEKIAPVTEPPLADVSNGVVREAR
jgi:dTDP-4-dehydrorhamnose reductase